MAAQRQHDPGEGAELAVAVELSRVVSASPPSPATVTATVTATPPAAPTAPAASADLGGAEANSKFLVGSQVSSGTWQCDKAGDLPYWSVNAQDNSIIDNGLDTIAIVPDSGYTLTLEGCSSLSNDQPVSGNPSTGNGSSRVS